MPPAPHSAQPSAVFQDIEMGEAVPGLGEAAGLG